MKSWADLKENFELNTQFDLTLTVFELTMPNLFHIKIK